MEMNHIDWIIVTAYIIFALVIAAVYFKRAGKGMDEFFASGRSMPWWLLGTSMVATTFSTDTPNLVTNLVREKGVSYNWIWWAFLLTGMLTVFFYARLWRRSSVLTDLEFYEIGYSGRSAAIVRGFRSLYLGLFFNCVIMASVTLAAVKIANVLFGWSRIETILYCSVLVIVFSVVSGFWGVVVTDLVQFAMAMVGSVAVAVYALKQDAVGGLSGLVSHLDKSSISLLPDFGNWELLLSVLIIPLAVQWWSVWYPGAEPGGGSYIAQRMLASKNERHSMIATLWFNIAHYGVRPWPWILVALCSLLVFPELKDLQRAFPHISPGLIGHDMAYPAMLKFLPHGLLGVMVASLLAAYVSTIDTHLNWGASYLVYDFYRRFVNRTASEKHYVFMSRITTALLMIIAALVMFFLENARESFDLLLSIGAGTGLLYLLRWFWWRINAWSEISAMVSSFCIAVVFFILNKKGYPVPSHIVLVTSVLCTTVIWVLVTLLTKPVDRKILVDFYRLIRPFGRGWESIRNEAGLPPSVDSLPNCLIGWIAGCSMVYSSLFGLGNLFYGRHPQAMVCAAVFLISTGVLVMIVPKIFRGQPDR